MKVIIALFLVMAPLALADGTMESSIVTKPACNTTQPECAKDMDCPQINCIRAPCPEAVCRSGKCVTIFPPAAKPVQEPTKPISPPVRPPINDPITAPVSPPLRAPVTPVAPITIPIGTGPKCGKNTCKFGDVCCNESCGICTPKGGGCVDLACEENPTSRPTGKPRFIIQPTPIGRPPIRAPVPIAAVRCGPNVCKPGKVCCNESCGICTEVGEGCNKKLCIKTLSPTNKPKNTIRPRTNSPVHKPGYCKVDLDCPVPPCAKPIDDTIDFYCPIPICVHNQCIFAPRPTRKPAPKPIGPSSGYCRRHIECRAPACLPESKECHIGKCVSNKCRLVPAPPIGKCYVDADCPVACSLLADIDGKPVPCTKSYCVNHMCTKVKPPSSLTKCGNVMCTADENCCNASCGDCIHKFSKRACSNEICTPAVQCRFDSDCKMGKSCDNGQCILKDVSQDVPCGKNTCAGGDVCCDPLCGTCAKPGVSCILGCKIEDPLQ